MNCLALLAAVLLAQGGIEPLAPPKPAAPPRADAPDDVQAEDLEKKRAQRLQREQDLLPPAESPVDKARRELAADAAAPRPHRFFAEISLLAGGALTSGDKSGYSLDPTSHFNVLTRSRPDARAWYGLRIAPFAGTGYYKRKPGAYGLTYFGPMIGLGKIDPPAQGRDLDPARPVAGWLATAGIAALAKSGRTETAAKDTRHSDFTAHKGVIIDGLGLWAEARYLRVLYGALGIDAVLGLQTGYQRQFVYAGVGTSGIY